MNIASVLCVNGTDSIKYNCDFKFFSGFKDNSALMNQLTLQVSFI